jgi:integrase
VDLRRGKVTIKSRKGSQVKRYQVREIDLHPRVCEIPAAQKERQQTGRYVLTDEVGEPWKPWKAHAALKRIVRGTEFEGIGFHTLRHSFSSNLARAGVDDRTIDYFMGHQSEEMRRRYQHLFPQTKGEAIGRLGY